MALKCDSCGRFSRHHYPVFENSSCPGVDREVCEHCAPADALEMAARMAARDAREGQ